MTTRSILLSYVGIALAGVGFSLSFSPSSNAMNIYNEHLPRIGIDAGIYLNPSYNSWEQ